MRKLLTKSLSVFTSPALTAFAAFVLVGCTPRPLPESSDELINDNWQFVRIEGELSESDSLQIIAGTLPLEATEVVNLPHTPRLESLTVNDQWQGTCFYAKELVLTREDLSKTLFIKFEAAMNLAQVHVNGRLACVHKGGYLPFIVSLDGYVQEGVNHIVVCLDNRDNKETGPKPLHLLDFNTYGGIYRNVHLIKKTNLFITDENGGRTRYGVSVNSVIAPDSSAVINARVCFANPSCQETSVHVQFVLLDKDGDIVTVGIVDTVAGRLTDVEASLKVRKAHLWSPSDPYLYTLEVGVVEGIVLKDVKSQKIGLRTLEVKPEGLYINGEQTFLRGVNRHQEYPYIGYALSDEAQWRDAWKIKEGGFDYVRCSHYPPSPAFLDACDQLGIMVLDAILGWQYFGDEIFEAHAINSSRELIRRDRNHPCVLAWELSINETQMPQSFTDTVGKIRDAEMPGSLTAGWMKANYDIYIEARQHRHGVDTARALLVSEYADWEYYAQNAGFNQDGWGDLLEEERSSRQPRHSSEARLLQQATNVQEAHNDNRSTHAFADGYWAFADYNRGYANDQEYSGAMDIFRQGKYAYEFFRSQRTAKSAKDAMIFIASECSEQSARSVRVFSNCPEIRFWAGEKEVEAYTTLEKISTNLETVPRIYNVGEQMPESLTAVGYINGKEVCRHTVRRAGGVQAITLRVDADKVAPKAGKNDPIFVHADLVDANGTVCRSESGEVTLKLTGDAMFATPEGFSRQFSTRALAGTASAVVVIGQTAGKVTLEATCGEMAQTKTFKSK